MISCPDVLIAMNEPSLRKFAPQVPATGTILYNATHLPADFQPPEARVICVPASEIADRLGSTRAANIVMLGALLEETECLASSTAMETIEKKVKKVSMLEINRKALAAGRQYIDHEAHIGAVSQPDGCGE